MPNGIKIQEDALFDGMFPLITNIETKELSMKEVLLKYKFQPYIEKRHQQFKSEFEAAPSHRGLDVRVLHRALAKRSHRTRSTYSDGKRKNALAAYLSGTERMQISNSDQNNRSVL